LNTVTLLSRIPQYFDRRTTHTWLAIISACLNRFRCFLEDTYVALQENCIFYSINAILLAAWRNLELGGREAGQISKSSPPSLLSSPSLPLSIPLHVMRAASKSHEMQKNFIRDNFISHLSISRRRLCGVEPVADLQHWRQSMTVAARRPVAAAAASAGLRILGDPSV